MGMFRWSTVHVDIRGKKMDINPFFKRCYQNGRDLRRVYGKLFSIQISPFSKEQWVKFFSTSHFSPRWRKRSFIFHVMPSTLCNPLTKQVHLVLSLMVFLRYESVGFFLFFLKVFAIGCFDLLWLVMPDSHDVAKLFSCWTVRFCTFSFALYISVSFGMNLLIELCVLVQGPLRAEKCG